MPQKVRDAPCSKFPWLMARQELRVDIDYTSNERMQKKIRDAQLQKIPLHAGGGRTGREEDRKRATVAVRLRSGKDLGAVCHWKLSSPRSKTRRDRGGMWPNSRFPGAHFHPILAHRSGGQAPGAPTRRTHEGPRLRP